MSILHEARDEPPRRMSVSAAAQSIRALPPPVLKLLRVITAATLPVSLIVATNYASRVLETPPAMASGDAQFVYVPDPRFLRVIALGHTGAVADFLWFRTISYFGAHYHRDRFYPWLYKMCDVVTDLDPRAIHVYRFAGVILPWEANRPDDGIALLEKGLRNFPDSWYLHWLLGFNYYFFKGDLRKAGLHLGQAAKLPGADPYVTRLAAVVYAHGFDVSAAESFLVELANSTQDEEMRRVILLRQGELKLGSDIEALNEALRRYQERHGAAAPNLETLVSAGVLAEIPSEPFGGRYVLDSGTGEVRNTSGHSPLRLYVSKAREEYQKGNPVYR